MSYELARVLSAKSEPSRKAEGCTRSATHCTGVTTSDACKTARDLGLASLRVLGVRSPHRSTYTLPLDLHPHILPVSLSTRCSLQTSSVVLLSSSSTGPGHRFFLFSGSGRHGMQSAQA